MEDCKTTVLASAREHSTALPGTQRCLDHGVTGFNGSDPSFDSWRRRRLCYLVSQKDDAKSQHTSRCTYSRPRCRQRPQLI